MEKHTEVCSYSGEFRKARASMSAGACVEASFHPLAEPGCRQVHVRNSRFPERVALVPLERWEALARTARYEGHVQLETWFPKKEYGDFADTFTSQESQAFESGVMNGDPELMGPST